MMILKGAHPLSNLSKFPIITLSTSYDNNLLYFMSTYETKFVNVPEKKMKKFCS